VKLQLDRGADVSLRANRDRKDSFLNSGQTAILVASGCFIAHRCADLAPERHMPPKYVAYEPAAAEKMVHELIAHGADVNDTDVYGQTPLMMAAMQGWSDAAAELLGANAAVNARDREGRLAIDYADPADDRTVGVLKRSGSMPATGNSGRSVCDAERALHKLGYGLAITDCIGDRDLRAAVIKFQQEHGLDTSGELDSTTRAKLGIR
jgi:ankyrin repeat protein